MEKNIKYKKFLPGETVSYCDCVTFQKMKQLVQQDISNLKINLNSEDYRKEQGWKSLEKMLMTDTEKMYIYSEAWFVEQYFLTREQYIKVNSCYAMGTGRKLDFVEMNMEAMCEALSINSLECYEMDIEDIKRDITRKDKKGLIIRVNELFGFDIESFDDKNEEYKLLFLFRRFEGKYGSKTLGEFLRKPSLENVDNTCAGVETVNGEMMLFLKYELEKELPPDFIFEAKSVMAAIAEGWEKQIRVIRSELDRNLYLDNSEEIERTYRAVGGYAQFYNKTTYCHGRIKHSLLETVYIKLIEHEMLGLEYDIIDVGQSLQDLQYYNTDDQDFYKKLAEKKVRIDCVDDFLEKYYYDMIRWVLKKDKTTSNEKDRYERAAVKVKHFVKMFQENTKYREKEEVDVLLLVICIREYLSMKSKDIVENKYYRAGDLAKKSIKSELTENLTRQKSKAVWIERVMRRYNACFHDMKLVSMVRDTEKYLDWLFVRNLQTNSIEDLRYIYMHFMFEIQGMIYPQKEMIKKKNHIEKILLKKAYKWTFQIPEGDNWSPARKFFSLDISDTELKKFAKTIKKAMSDALNDHLYKDYVYEIKVLQGYFGDNLFLEFSLRVDPECRKIFVSSAVIDDSKMRVVLDDNGIIV